MNEKSDPRYFQLWNFYILFVNTLDRNNWYEISRREFNKYKKNTCKNREL